MKQLISSRLIKILLLCIYPLSSLASGLDPATREAFQVLSSYKKLPPTKEARKKLIKRHKGEYLGVLGEHIAWVESKRRHPEQQVLRNVKFETGPQHDRQEGELDIVVIDPKTGQVTAIKEVKCCWDVYKAQKKGRKQLKKFNNLIQERKKSQKSSETLHKLLFSVDPEANENIPPITTSSFFNEPALTTVTYKYWEAEEAGFDEMIDLEYEDLEAMLEIFAELDSELHKNLRIPAGGAPATAAPEEPTK